MSDGIASKYSVPVHTSIDILPSKGDTKIATLEKSEVVPPFSVYKDIGKVPYTAEYLKVSLINPVTADKVKTIEDFMGQEIKLRGMKDDIGSYKDIMKDIKRFLEIDDRDSAQLSLNKLYHYADLKMKAHRFEVKKRKLMDEIDKLIGKEESYGY